MLIRPRHLGWPSTICKSMVRKTSILREDTLRETVTVYNVIMTPREEEMRIMSDFLTGADRKKLRVAFRYLEAEEEDT